MKRNKLKKRSKEAKLEDLVIERIEILSNISRIETIHGNYDYSRKLNELIFRLSLKNKVKIPVNIKRSICKNCHVTLIPGVTSTIRVKSQGKFHYLTIKCKECGYIKRIPFHKDNKRY
ncbi:RNase P subunit RPR2 [Caldisphaera lagunensis DSM 15908]|uniref:Ribonuclease P protein component 4 n=1 Tax=Caldisphaera lagunensis (strain DSM 15908 / JCM 11604 / ANMR 0165 / IC-154) TaxID=1056495 RepID=L0ABB8_CALLD|nr:ribonuclease P Rpr2/Rpp21/SNM1 subunit [Caldisphaera lagunensis]AFZ71156.1 RNase P subunit RPR2 [Caldisphaera lagunensis DSM 15908]